MKLNTLLLTSAATLMATSVAFAADLPSKKAAPAAGSVQVCKVGGLTGWTLPGSDTCFQIGGRVTYDHNIDFDGDNDDGIADFAQGAGYRLNFDARSNTEMGTLRSFIELEDNTTRRAYIQLGGFTAGRKSSIADIAGTSGNQFGAGWSQPGTGLQYVTTVNGLTVGVAADVPNNWNTEDATVRSSADMPDLIGHLSMNAGAAKFTVAGVVHEANDMNSGATVVDTATGYALVGQVTIAAGGVNLIGFGGISNAASRYTGNFVAGTATSTIVDYSDGVEAEGVSYGGEINAKIGSATVAFAARYFSVEGERASDAGAVFENESMQYGVYASIPVVKGMTFQPEYLYTQNTVGGVDEEDTQILYLRIQRDF